jgi:hypothetical protein
VFTSWWYAVRAIDIIKPPEAWMATSSAREAGSERTEQTRSGQARTATVRLPFVTAQFRVPDVDVGSVVRVARSSLPTPRRALYYGGLASLAAFSVIDWPVAVAIGIGTEIARREAIHQSQRRAIEA